MEEHSVEFYTLSTLLSQLGGFTTGLAALLTILIAGISWMLAKCCGKVVKNDFESDLAKSLSKLKDSKWNEKDRKFLRGELELKDPLELLESDEDEYDAKLEKDEMITADLDEQTLQNIETIMARVTKRISYVGLYRVFDRQNLLQRKLQI